jgi:hypothetical protein
VSIISLFAPVLSMNSSEALDPADAAAALEPHVGRMNELLDRRVPPQANVARADFVHAHAAGGDDADRELAVVDRDQFDPFLLAAVEDDLLDPPGDRAVGRDLFALDRGLGNELVRGAAGEHAAEGLGGRGLSGDLGSKNEHGERGQGAFHERAPVFVRGADAARKCPTSLALTS